MKAESTIRKTMQRLCKEGRGNGSQERCRMAFDMAIALQWVIEGTCWNPVSFLDEVVRDAGEFAPDDEY
ncbi:hypothetical protein LCGC14_1598140 [marine sediment metagenome]|uniref:Uncharacterized protein n=1 Tax=marine sediment metagenome TaxID=412755 RepID=A0A0F9LC79_9ZZZZ